MFRKLITKKRALVLGAVAMLAVAGIAIAYFTSTGTGTGSASVGKASEYTVAVTSNSSEALYPGSGEETLTYTVTNNAAGTQKLASTSASVASEGGNIKSGGVAVPGCSASWFNAANTAPAAVELAHGEHASGSVKVTMNNVEESQNACQGKSPEITVKAE